jgi:AraC-like DNA-binding protein
VVIDTQAAAPGDPVAFWRDEASRVFQPLRVHPDDRSSFWARSVAHDLCGITLTRTCSVASTIVRTRDTIAEFDPELLTLVLHLRGSYRLTREEQTDVCGAGDMAFLDSSRPFTARSDGPIDIVTVGLPKWMVRPHLARAAALSAMRIPGDSGAAALARPYVLGLLDGLGDGGIASDDESVADCVVSLVGTLVAEPAAQRASRPAPLRAIKRYIDEHLPAPGLGPEQIARANHISTRYLHRLFEGEGLSVSEWIRDQRLERCRRDLRDPLLRHESILSIASRWGLPSSAHFSRVFRAAYGRSPREERRLALGS